MAEQVPSKDLLPKVHLTPEQDARAVALGKQMTADYLGNYSAARVIVHLQDEVARLETHIIERQPLKVTEINAAVDERLDRVERELMNPDHPENDWQCGFCAWMNFGSRTSCGNCEMSRPAQPPGDG